MKMNPRKSLLLGAAAGCMALAQPVLAMPVPGIQSVSVQCQGSSPPFITVQVTFAALADGPSLEFQNVATGHKITWAPFGLVLTENIPLPAGTYNLTVKQRIGQGPQSLWNNIVVPVAVSTNGRGTGCRFLNTTETPANQTVKHN